MAKANKNLAVVLVSGNAVAMPWIKEVPSVLQSWYLGSESGHAIAAILSGDINPSGKLPFTFPVKLEDNSAHALGEYPGNKEELAAGKGKELKDPINITYNEGIFVGYRWHDTKNKILCFCKRQHYLQRRFCCKTSCVGSENCEGKTGP